MRLHGFKNLSRASISYGNIAGSAIEAMGNLVIEFCEEKYFQKGSTKDLDIEKEPQKSEINLTIRQYEDTWLALVHRDHDPHNSFLTPSLIYDVVGNTGEHRVSIGCPPATHDVAYAHYCSSYSRAVRD